MENFNKIETEEISSIIYNSPDYISNFISNLQLDSEERKLFIAEFLDFNKNRSAKCIIKEVSEMLSNNQISGKKEILKSLFETINEIPIPIGSRFILNKILQKFLSKFSLTLDQELIFKIINIICVKLKLVSLDKKSILKIVSSLSFIFKSKENLQENFIKIVSENNRNINYVFLSGLFIRENLKIKDSLEKVFLTYYEKYVLDDYDREKNLISQNILNPILDYLSEKSIIETLLPNCESLMKRSKQNYVFITNIFCNFKLKCDIFRKIVFNQDFQEYFFTYDEKILHSAIRSYQNLIGLLSSNAISSLIEDLLNLDFSADKNDLNINVCLFLTQILHDFEVINKVQSRILRNDEILKIVNFIFKKAENASETTKIKYEKIFENLLFGLLQVEVTGSLQDTNKQLLDNFFNQSKKLSTNTYSYLYNYTFNIIKLIIEKMNLLQVLPKNYFDSFFSQLSNSSISISNYKIPISILSLCLLFSQKNEIFDNNQKTISAGFNDLFLNNEFKSFASNDFLYHTISNFEVLNILDSLRFIISNQDLYEYLGEDVNEVFVIVSKLFLSKNLQKSYEVKSFSFFIEKIMTEKHQIDQILDNILINTFNNFNGYPLEKLSFKKVSKLCLKYIDFYQEFSDQDFVKFLYISTIPCLNYDVSIQQNIMKNDGKFIKKIYSILEKQLNVNIFDKFDQHFDLFCQIIFSELGIYNTRIPLLKQTSNRILMKMIENENLMKRIFEIITKTLDFSKFKYLDDIYKYYISQIDYISFYDLSYIVDSLKNLENTYFNKINKVEIKEKEIQQNIQLQKKGGKQPQKVVNAQKPKPANKQVEKTEKVDKEVKYKNDKSYVDYYIIRQMLNVKNNITALLNILRQMNNNDNYREYFKSFTIILWKLMKVDFLREFLKSNLINLFQKNKLISNLSNEFANFMIITKIPGLLESVLEAEPKLVNSLNEKLEKIVNTDNSTRVKIFEYYDLLIVKFLFFIILNNDIPNDDKIISVDIIIKIMDNFKNLINFNKISKLVNSLLKSSYNSENISSLIDMFFKKAPEENFLILCGDILDFEVIPKQAFLEQMLKLKMTSLKKYKNLVYKIWILLFNDSEQISHGAKEVWNQFKLYIDHDYLQSDEIKLVFKDNKNSDLIHKSIITFSHIFPSLNQQILNKYQEFYQNEVKSQQGENYQNRSILFSYIEECIDLFDNKLKKDLLDFILKVSDLENQEEIFELMKTTINHIVKSIEEEKLCEQIVASIEERLSSIQVKNKDNINFKNLQIILMTLLSILKKNESKLRRNTSGVLRKEKALNLYSLLSNMCQVVQNQEVLYIVSNCFQFLAKINEETSKTLMENICNNFRNSGKNIFQIGQIYILTGLIKYFGIKQYRLHKIDEFLKENLKKNKSTQEKKNCLNAIRILSFSLKKIFEPYLLSLFDMICEAITDREPDVRETAQTTIKSFMKDLSGYAVKTIMPRLIKDLHTINWRSKVVNIEILGQFAFCAPKQLSVYIPVVIKEIMQVFKDPHPKVQEIAILVLKDISSVIKNPEIVDLSEILINAISNPADNSKNALTALLETDFKHAIDPPSLGLIIPIIDYALKSHDENNKKMASHLIGSFANLITNPMDIYAYIDIIMPNLKNALFDSIPECRNAVAKAIGSLTKSLGSKYLEEMLRWIKSYLEKESDTIQRSGAAQAYAEIMIAYGESYIDKMLPQIITLIRENNRHTKEGYLGIFVFLPGCLGDKFEKYFDFLLPLILEGLSDEYENVRNVSNRIFEICIKLFAKRNTSQLIEPLILGLFDQNWRIRCNSIALIKTLIINLNKEFMKDSSTFFTKEQRDEILACCFILKADAFGNTSIIANQIWRDYVDNIPKYLNKIIQLIYEKIRELLISDKEEQQDLAEAAVKLIVEKFSDKFYVEMLPCIKESITKNKDEENIVYPSFYIIDLAVINSSERLLSNYKERLIKLIIDNIETPIESARKILASIINGLTDKFDDRQISIHFVKTVFKMAKTFIDVDEQIDLLEIVAKLVEISEGEIIDVVLKEIFRKPVGEAFLELAKMISGDIAELDVTEIREVINNLSDCLISFPKIATEAIVDIIDKIEEDDLHLFIDCLEKIKKKKENIIEDEKTKDNSDYYLSILIVDFLEKTEQNFESIQNQLFDICATLMRNDDEEILKNISISFKLLVEKSEKTCIDIFVKSFNNNFKELIEKMNFENIQNIQQKVNIKFKLMMENLLVLLQNGLLYGEEKLCTSEYIDILVKNSEKETLKPYILKITGPIIRILSEKYPQNIKEKLLENLKIVILKCQADIKNITPQLQAIFIKILMDSSPNNERVQLRAGENIIRLLQYYARIENVSNDIIKSILSKVEKNEANSTIIEAEILSDLIRFYGSSIKPETLKNQFGIFKDLIYSKKIQQYDTFIMLLSTYTKYFDYEETIKLIENVNLNEEYYNQLFSFLTVFNGNVKVYNNFKKKALTNLKSQPKDQAITCLKMFGKIINKYQYFIDFDMKNFTELLSQYEVFVNQTIIETDLFKPTNNILDANLCVFILSLNYLQIYDQNSKETLNKLIRFLLDLMEQGKINSQLLVNVLSLLLLKVVVPNPNKDDIMEAVNNLEFLSEEDIQSVEDFMKKIYYLYH